MANFMADKLPDNLTWWSATGPDGYGGDAFASPVLIKGRWEDRAEKYIGQIDRRELISQAIVFVDRDIAVGDYLVQGDLTAQPTPVAVAGAFKVQQYRKTSDLKSLEHVRRAVL